MTYEELKAFKAAGAYDDAKERDILRAHIAAVAQAMRDQAEQLFIAAQFHAEGDPTRLQLLARVKELKAWADRLEGKAS